MIKPQNHQTLAVPLLRSGDVTIEPSCATKRTVFGKV